MRTFTNLCILTTEVWFVLIFLISPMQMIDLFCFYLFSYFLSLSIILEW
jgi:hypothetical protein